MPRRKMKGDSTDPFTLKGVIQLALTFVQKKTPNYDVYLKTLATNMQMINSEFFNQIKTF